MALHPGHEVGGGVPGEGGLDEMRAAGGPEVDGCRVEVREIASAAPGDEDLAARSRGMFQHEDPASAGTRRRRAEQARGPRAQHNDVKRFHALPAASHPGGREVTRIPKACP